MQISLCARFGCSWHIFALSLPLVCLLLTIIVGSEPSTLWFVAIYQEPLRIVADRHDLLFIFGVSVLGLYLLRRSIRRQCATMERELLRKATFVETEEFEYLAQRLLADHCTFESTFQL